MADTFTPEARSRLMGRVKTRDTKPEKIVRAVLHRMGYRFRLQGKNLPGKPDIVLPKHRKVIFVHGCFWHGHIGCNRASRPTSNIAFWNRKIDGNINRDLKVKTELTLLGWKVLTIWQCEIKDLASLQKGLLKFLTESKENGRKAHKRNNKA